MFSAGMFAARASAMTVRSRGFISGSPPLLRAATVNSLMRRVNTLPRLASAAPFLCLIVAHFEWPDMAYSGPREVDVNTDLSRGPAFGPASARLRTTSVRHKPPGRVFDL